MKRKLLLVVLCILVFSINIGYASDNTSYDIEQDNIRIKEMLDKQVDEMTKKSLADGKNEMTINGQITPQYFYHEWFERYVPDYTQHINEGYLIANITFDTRGEAGTTTTMEVTINTSRQVTWENSGSITVTAEIRAAMFAKLEAALGYQLTNSTTTSNQVGASKNYNLYTGRTGYVQAWYHAANTGGAVIYGYEELDGNRGTYVKGHTAQKTPYKDNALRAHFGKVVYN